MSVFFLAMPISFAIPCPVISTRLSPRNGSKIQQAVISWPGDHRCFWKNLHGKPQGDGHGAEIFHRDVQIRREGLAVKNGAIFGIRCDGRMPNAKQQWFQMFLLVIQMPENGGVLLFCQVETC